MTELTVGLDSLETILAEAWPSLAGYLPRLVTAVLLVVLGWLVARLLRAVVVRFGSGFNTLLSRFSSAAGASRQLQITPTALALIGNVLFWVTLLVVIALAARVARLEVFATGLDRIVAYVPTLLAGGLILLAGFLVSVLVRDVVSATLETAGSQQSALFGTVSQGAVFAAALVVGLDQIGIDVTFLTVLFGIVVAGLLLSLAVAFGLGASSFVSNLLGASQFRQVLAPGQFVRIRDMEGHIIELTPTAVVLSTASGRLSVPAKLLQEEATLVVLDHEEE